MVGRLRTACADERLSVDTFIARLECAYAARTRIELAALVADLPRSSRLAGMVIGAINSASRWTRQLAAAWREPRLERLVLPTEPRTVIGRAHLCDCVISSATVSREHAVIRHEAGRWWLQDRGSTNGTFLNGWRVVSEIEIRPGDQLTLGDVQFVLRSAPETER